MLLLKGCYYRYHRFDKAGSLRARMCVARRLLHREDHAPQQPTHFGDAPRDVRPWRALNVATLLFSQGDGSLFLAPPRRWPPRAAP
jgi:hypothetical protein